LKKLQRYLFIPILLVLQTLGACTFISTYPMTSVSLGTWGVTGKSPVDHAISGATDQDCSWMRLLNSDPMCNKGADAKAIEDKTSTVLIESKR
jgi:hypothetical protein